MNEEQSVILYRKLTFIFAILFVVILVFHTIPNLDSKQDKFCQKYLGDKDAYAKEVPMSTPTGEPEYTCCKMFEVSNYEKGTVELKEGCSNPNQ